MWDCRRKGTKRLNPRGILRGGGRELEEAWSFDSHMGFVFFCCLEELENSCPIISDLTSTCVKTLPL